MKIGAKVYIVEGTRVLEFEIIEIGSNIRILNQNGESRVIHYQRFNNIKSSDITFSRIIAYSTLEENLIKSLIETRKIIRKHRQQFHTSDNFEEFKAANTFEYNFMMLEEIEAEITDANYHETYKEDELTDTQHE